MPPRRTPSGQISSSPPPAANPAHTTEPFPPIDLSPTYASIARRGSSSHAARPVLDPPSIGGSGTSNDGPGPIYSVSSVYVDGRAEDNPPPSTWRARRLAYEARQNSIRNNDNPPSHNLLSAEDIDASGVLDDLNPVPSLGASSSSGAPPRAQSVPADVVALHRQLTNPSRIRNTDTGPNTVDRAASSSAVAGSSSGRTPATIAPSRASTSAITRSGSEPWRQYLPWTGRGLFPGEDIAQNALARHPPQSSSQRNPDISRPIPTGAFRSTFPSITGPRSGASVSAEAERRAHTTREQAAQRQAERAERAQTDRDRQDRMRSVRRYNILRRQLDEGVGAHDMDLFLSGQSDDDDDEDHDDDMDVDDDDADEFMFSWTGGNVATGDDGSGAMFALSNRSTEDLPTVGGSGGTLRRGGNNRHRLSRQLAARASAGRSLREIESLLREEEDAAGMEQDVLRTFERASLNRPTGLRPTNTGVRNDPVVVKTKEKESESADGASSRKKRKCVHYSEKARDEEVKYDPPPTLPTYLSQTNLDDAVPLPMVFMPPPLKFPRLTLTTHSSQTSPPRPCITFTYSPIPDGHRGDSYAQALRTDISIPVACGVHYYEAEVLDAGKCGYMSVGWVSEKTDLERLVGWDQGSYGWHGDDGMSFEGCGTGVPFSELWSTGDTVGCGIDYTKKTAFFTKNGKLVGERFKNLGEGLYPAIGLRTPGESIVVNFTGPFRFDIDNYARNLRDKTWRAALAEPESDLPVQEPIQVPSLVTPNGKATEELGAELPRYSRLEDPSDMTNAAFVLDYLRQSDSGALSLLRNTMKDRKWIKAPAEAIEMRKDAKELDEKATLDDFESIEACLIWVEQRIIYSNSLPLPLDLVNALWQADAESTDEGECAARNGLAILDYVRLVQEAQRARSKQEPSDSYKEPHTDSAEADDLDQQSIERARTLREASSTWSEACRTRLTEAIGLIGLDISRWPASGVAGEAYRVEVAEGVVRHIRAQRGLKGVSYLSQAFSQTIASLRIAASAGDASAAFVDPTRILTDAKALPSTSTSIRGAKRKATGEADGNVVEEGQVKLEPEET